MSFEKFIIMVVSYREFHYPKNPLGFAHSSHSSYPKFLTTTDLFIVYTLLLSPEYHIVVIIQWVAFHFCSTISNVHLRILHVFSCLITFLVLHNIPLHQYTIVYLPIHIWRDILIVLKIINKSSVNNLVQVFAWTYVFSFLG